MCFCGHPVSFWINLADTCKSCFFLCSCVRCSRPARRQLFGRDVQTGPPFWVPLHWTGLLEGSHHRRRACYHPWLHHDNWNLLQGNTRRDSDGDIHGEGLDWGLGSKGNVFTEGYSAQQIIHPLLLTQLLGLIQQRCVVKFKFRIKNNRTQCVVKFGLSVTKSGLKISKEKNTEKLINSKNCKNSHILDSGFLHILSLKNSQSSFRPAEYAVSHVNVLSFTTKCRSFNRKKEYYRGSGRSWLKSWVVAL